MRRGAPRVWLPPTKFRPEIWGVSHGHRPLRPAGGRGTARRVVVPYGWLRRAAAIALASGAQRSVCGADGRNEEESEQRLSPGVQQPRTIPQSPSGRQLPLHKGAFGDGGCGLPRRPCGPPRNDNGFLSFRGAERRGNPSFFTMDGGSGRRGRRPLRKARSTTQTSRRAAKRPRPQPRGTGGNRCKGHPKRGPPRLPGQRLAKRKARKESLVKFGFCPITELCSTGYGVRKSQQSPARALVGAASTEQDRLEPRPAARQGAPRRNCAAKSVFSFDGSTAVFFLGRQKENGGGKPAGVARHPRLVNRTLGVPAGNPSVTAAPCQLPLHKGAFFPAGDGGRLALRGSAACGVAVRAGGYSPPGWGCRSPGR